MSLPQIDPITAAIMQLAERLTCVESQATPLEEVAGCVLAEPLCADRDSPPLNVSAMDGYALRMADAARSSTLPIAQTAMAGWPAPDLPAGAAVRIFTGAPVPDQADCVIPRELTIESPAEVQLNVPVGDLKPGMNIRMRGENALGGSPILPKGTWLSSAAMSAVASVAGPTVMVHRPVRVAILNTGDELIAPGQPVQPWQIRDSNGPTLLAALGRHPWIEVISRARVNDTLEGVVSALRSCEQADAILLTGGVSMGDTDHVPAAIADIGGEIVFHRLPIRPGKPVLGAVRIMSAGPLTKERTQLIIGLPGNPVSVAVTASAISLPLLKCLAGIHDLLPNQPRVMISRADTKQLNLQWYRLVQLTTDGQAEYVDNRGSGDLISLAKSVGYVKLPTGASGAGPWELTLW
ncbi:MAG: molybdopterin molybdotransferase MoeA [Pirellulaceae bacterium]|nr:molybdopterin molybdotransferase MoeA [Pirellulaceae bacterium]